MAYAKSKGMGIAVMGPVGGGRIARFSPQTEAFASVNAKTGAEMAMRFVLANPNVDCAVSGMSNMEMVLENTEIAANTDPLSPKEVESINQIMEEKKKLAELYCTGCNYCMPCPQKVDIAYMFELMNTYRIYEAETFAKDNYAKAQNDWKNSADQCTACGACEPKCPQGIPIIKQLKECHEVLG